MLPKLVVLAAMAVCVSAQNISVAYYFNINNVSAADRISWCTSEETVCDTLCSGSSSANSCSNTDLSYSCICSANHSAPGLEFYNNTIPTLKCQSAYANCIAAHPNDRTGQTACTTQIENTCGHIDSTNMTFGTTTSTASATASKTASATGTSATASATSTANSAAGAMVGAGQQYGLGGLAAAAVAAFGFLL